MNASSARHHFESLRERLRDTVNWTPFFAAREIIGFVDLIEQHFSPDGELQGSLGMIRSLVHVRQQDSALFRLEQTLRKIEQVRDV
ncbi:hypothetical protein QZM42_05420 [Burkholderia vietnamiensis]|uniref:hypothetical protein n=1 Tax=Burkholderia vietnamiensis TaxID=60552 RepID=UPI00264B4AD5|nr:hypothetical protein [Burkholderia vietnamiensis]MDN7407984.1 hypothetical protein [Burkholderia vietnamiensis]